MPERKAEYKELPVGLVERISSKVWDALGFEYGIGSKQLYKHQVQGLESVLMDQKDLVLATSTSSGKSLVFNIPIVQAFLDSDVDSVSALYIFPTVRR